MNSIPSEYRNVVNRNKNWTPFYLRVGLLQIEVIIIRVYMFCISSLFRHFL
jgi:hypothetical protein